MKSIILFILFIFISFDSESQTAWEKLYYGPNRPDLSDITTISGNEFFACGTDTSNSISRAILVKFDSSGNKLWEKNYAIQDSGYWFSHVIHVDSFLFIQASTYAINNGFYPVPRIIKLDTSGNVLDSTWIDISGVYNSTANLNLLPGANNSFWSITFVGTIGVSNEMHFTRWDMNLDTLRTFVNGAFYDFNYSFTRSGDFTLDYFIDEIDSTGVVWNPDHVRLYDSTGNLLSSTLYSNLPPSDEILRSADGGFSLFYSEHDSLIIRHFNAGGLIQYSKSYNATGGIVLPPVQNTDSDYFFLTLKYEIFSNTYTYSLWKMSDTDDTLWIQTFNFPALNNPEKIDPLPDGGAILLFNTTLYGDSINLLMRIGPEGELFPFSYSINPGTFCIGDTITLSLSNPAISYLWSTGDTLSSINITTTGYYNVAVTDSNGNFYSLPPVHLTFEAPVQALVNDVRSCLGSVMLSENYTGVTIYWLADSVIRATGQNYYLYADTIPDTVYVLVIVQSPGGCRTSDSAVVYFDDCTLVRENIALENIVVKSSDRKNFTIGTGNETRIESVKLTDLSGKEVFNEKYNQSEIHIHLDNLAAGIYILQGKTKEYVFSRKLIVGVGSRK